MNMNLDKHIIDQVNEAHRGVINSSKQAIERAIEAGELLTRIKDICEHGEFLAIVNSKFEFDRTTAFRYMRVSQYASKVAPLQHLQEAYKLIESEEAKKKHAKALDQKKKIEYRQQYNEKPDTWERADDYAWEKHNKEKSERNERIAQAKQTIDAQKEASQQEQASIGQGFDQLQGMIDEQQQRREQLQGLKIGDKGIITIIENYMSGLKDDNYRLEEYHNLLKYSKNKVKELQQSTYGYEA